MQFLPRTDVGIVAAVERREKSRACGSYVRQETEATSTA